MCWKIWERTQNSSLKTTRPKGPGPTPKSHQSVLRGQVTTLKLFLGNNDTLKIQEPPNPKYTIQKTKNQVFIFKLCRCVTRTHACMPKKSCPDLLHVEAFKKMLHSNKSITYKINMMKKIFIAICSCKSAN